MINYNDENIFKGINKKCLTFDPFNLKYNKFQIKINDPHKEKSIKEEYYECCENCFDLFDNLPLFNYHYEISCLCIKECYEKIKRNVY